DVALLADLEAGALDGPAGRRWIGRRDVEDAVGGVAVAVDVDVRLGDGLGRLCELAGPVLAEIDSEVLARGLHVRVPPPRRYRTSPPRHGCYSRLVRALQGWIGQRKSAAAFRVTVMSPAACAARIALCEVSGRIAVFQLM